jgi:hypothetical protein
VSAQDFSHPLMSFLDEPGDHFVNLASFLFAVAFTGRKAAWEQHGLTIAVTPHVNA